MAKRILISTIALLFANVVYGQVNFYMEFNETFSSIATVEETYTTEINDANGRRLGTIKYDVTESYDMKPGFNFGMGFIKEFNELVIFIFKSSKNPVGL